MKPNSSRILGHLKKISVFRHPEENAETYELLETYSTAYLKTLGYKVTTLPFIFHNRTFRNWIAQAPSEYEIPSLMIAAHLDAVSGSPGADDNASGLAALLETAELLANTEPLNVTFVIFNLEEYGMIGSQSYADGIRKGIHPRPAAMLSLEMLGYTDRRKGSQQMPLLLKPFYPDTGDFIALVGDGGSRMLLEHCKAGMQKVQGLKVESLTVPGRGWTFPETRLSDHSPFWDLGIPALMVTDTSFFRNPHYHLPSDTIETLDLEFLTKITEALTFFVQAWQNAENPGAKS